ncbi:10605_t:CDS:2 [Ambispora gerdemannii]|uniref:10605_t:CDS:1 n=1 Tax=Ambispora gerdemannii TaxID=144530 RepID=A0A9N9GHN4_9GLOM|nr:10605_t:CDS:2 [Ambispora gerdemannii]
MSSKRAKKLYTEGLEDILPDHNVGHKQGSMYGEVEGLQHAAVIANAGGLLTSVAALSSGAANGAILAGPIVQACAILFREIVDLTEKAEHNKKTCRRLTDRIRVANKILERKVRGVEIGNDNYIALCKYKDAIVEAKEFILRIKWKFGDLAHNLDTAIAQLGLEQIVRTRQDIEEDSKLLKDEIKTTFSVIEEVMRNIFNKEDSIVINVKALDEKMDVMHEAIKNMYNPQNIPSNLHKTRIDCKHITEIDDDEEESSNNTRYKSSHGNIRGQVRKMKYIAQGVAQKEIGYVDTLHEKPETIERQVAILTELKDCEYIIRFHGTMQRAGRLYIISEWAELGDLNSYLKNNPDLSWSFKIRIASEIASGLTFCHTFDILHHDIRSHNILLTENLVGKINNFSSSRKEVDHTLDSNHFKDLANQYKWLAPEKLREHKVPYTKQCDIYSFSIVLWELASQEMPFENYSTIGELISAVVSGTRPQLIRDTPSAYEKIMQEGWRDKPIRRPTASSMFKELNSLNKQMSNSLRHFKSQSVLSDSSTLTGSQHNSDSNIRNVQESSNSSIQNIPELSNSSIQNIHELSNPQPFQINEHSSNDSIKETPPKDPNECEDSGQLGIELYIDPRTVDVAHAKKLHQQKKYAQAWPIFKNFAEKGDRIAEFYVGYYLLTGDRGVPQNKELAVEYFRRSAEKGIADAQFRYGVALLCGEGVEKNSINDQIAIENLRKAAQNGNRNAMYNYGDLLINGAHGLPEDLDEGARWMRKAHDKGHPQAYKKLAIRLDFLNKPIPDDISKWLSTHG